MSRRGPADGPRAAALSAGPDGAGRSLTVLLSQLLVAFTMEFDNEAEHRIPHRTSVGPAAGSRSGPWLTSQVMWVNFLRHIPPAGIALSEVRGYAAITNLAGVRRWGYVVIEPDTAAGTVRLTRAGATAVAAWRPLAGEIEQRWRHRFGSTEVSDLRAALMSIVDSSELAAGPLPEYLPVVHNRLFADVERLTAAGHPVTPVRDAEPDLSVLLSWVLLALTVEVEQGAPISLPVGTNLLRVLTPHGVRLRDLPARGGVSAEAVSMALGVLRRAGYAVVEPEPGASRGQQARLTATGERAQREHNARVVAAEQEWRVRLGDARVDRLRDCTRAIGSQRDGEGNSILAAGLRPYPEGWRAHRPYLTATNRVLADPLTALPHYPMVLHRGGWPDGS